MHTHSWHPGESSSGSAGIFDILPFALNVPLTHLHQEFHPFESEFTFELLLMTLGTSIAL